MIRVLTYNIFWKAMTTNKKNIQPQCHIIHDDNLVYTSCAKNVAYFIDRQDPLDFVCLQEATNYQTLSKISMVLSKMKIISHKPGVESIVTFYDGSKYQLDEKHHSITGWMHSIHRPFLINFFNNNICLINLHAGHHGDIYHFDSYLKKLLSDMDDLAIYLHKLKTYQIIMAGDFNSNLSTKLSFTFLYDPFFQIMNGRQFYGLTKIPTCCTKGTDLSTITRVLDHIISTTTDIQSKIYKIPDTSDHMPIVAEINTQIGGKYSRHIGYDFDGVIHTYVSDPDILGQRHALDNNISIKYQFTYLLSNIKKQLDNGDSVYIITARDNNSMSLIRNFLSKTILADYQIPIYFTNNMDKTNVIAKLHLDEYYDDSCLRINQLTDSMTKNNLPNLKNLYFVNPDEKKWHKVSNIEEPNCRQYRYHSQVRQLAAELEMMVDNAVSRNDYSKKTGNKILQLVNKIKHMLNI